MRVKGVGGQNEYQPGKMQLELAIKYGHCHRTEQTEQPE
jgi:hypothetical protein